MFSVAPPAALILVLGPNGEAQFVPQTPVAGASAFIREVPDILTFVEAWMIFISVLQNQCLSLPITQALTAHLNNIIVVARAYPWASVLDYHVAFMQARALDAFFNPIVWMKSDPHLHTMHLLAPSVQAPVTAAAPSSTDHARMAGQACYVYNDKGCAGPAAGCYRRHICRDCGRPHPKSACRAATDTAAAPAA
ncbi:hypothetical protein FB451DRAFT_404549 [Mycena latifolia]|nr:hypothetical protein FB451DRAFT_404549 [Mycena latifolia]